MMLLMLWLDPAGLRRNLSLRQLRAILWDSSTSFRCASLRSRLRREAST
jgi:hypothetical protein